MIPFDEETRRKIKAQLGLGIMEHPCILRIERNVQEAGIRGCELYRIEGSTPDRNLYFDVYSLRKWAAENVAPSLTGLDANRVQALIKDEAIDVTHVEQMPIESRLEPIIIGVAAYDNGSDAVLDGQHRYVAQAFHAVRSGVSVDGCPIVARFIEPDQWQSFLIPRYIAVAMQMDAAF